MKNKASVFKSGYASLIGKPNVGKSTLLNRLTSEKIAAISSKPQTTRSRITGVAHLDGGQIILLDTPGIHKAFSKLNQLMVKAALNTLSDVDLILFLIDAQQGFTEDDAYALEMLKRVSVPVFLVVNKIDTVVKPKLLEIISDLNQKFNFAEIIPISALKDDGIDVLIRAILDRLPEGPRYFPEDMVMDCPEKFWVSEIIREKVMNLTHLEIPYSCAVLTDVLEEGRPGLLNIHATIYVEKISQKKIMIGEKGKRIKQIGKLARGEIEKRFACQVFLNLFVKVKNGWSQSNGDLRELGYINDTY
ncbi:MAG: GTPase Era [Candidatus Nitrohelix vancouverensis]|uniref:GTPase Era n=1 Tax=Candidatus Nitrohelix vancouverensis TaxID=2705534 RepID=A0A7T0C4B8_9BACT|nr:MAG: GTPase Era [Candidatus Nitrohelix vancouverensis]